MVQENLLQKLFLDIANEHPFSSSKFYSFFGYTRHNDFLRALDDPKFYKHLIFDQYDVVNERKASSIEFDRQMFLKLCKRRKISVDIFEEFYFEYRKLLMEKRTSSFSSVRKDGSHNLDLWNRPASKFYDHSLNTINIATAIGIDAFDLYRFCATELQFKVQYVRNGIKGINSNFFSERVPYMTFDSLNSNERMGIDSLIGMLLELYPLSNIEKKLLEHYRQCIRKMLSKQVGIEHKKRFYREKQWGNHTHRIYSTKETKSIYRKGSMLFHPDKNANGEELFKAFNKLYVSGDLIKMKKMIQNYGNPS